MAWSSRGTLLKADIAVKDCGLESEGCQPSQKASLLRACLLTVGVRVGKVQTPIQSLSACNSIKPRILRNPKWPQVGIPQRMVAQPLNRTPGNRFLKPGQRQGRDRGPLIQRIEMKVDMVAKVPRQAYLKQSSRKDQNTTKGMAQWLREQAVLAENLGSLPSPPMETHKHL